MENTKIKFEGTITDVKFHNSKVDDNSWTDLTIRVAGQYGIQAAGLLPRAKEKLVNVEFEIDKND